MPRKIMKRRASTDEDSASEAGAPLAKKTKSGPAGPIASGAIRGDDGNTYWQLPKNKRVTVSEFRKTTYINIREYYQKDDKFLPGKKGISLGLEEYAELLKAIPAINAEIQKQTGQSFDNPDDTNVPVGGTKPNPVKKKPEPKANIDTTSEEED